MKQLESKPSGLALPLPENSTEESLDEIDVASDSPVFPLNINEMISISALLLKSAIPTSITYVAEFVIGLACLRFVGKSGTQEELAGASLGFTWANVFCLGIFCSIDQGFSVMASRLYGAGKYRELGILFQRNLCVLAVVAIPLIFSLLFADHILLALGLESAVAINAGIYLRHVIPSLIGTAVFNSFRFYLISQNVFNFQGILLAALIPLHIFWCYLFVDVLNMSVAGAAFAKSITDVTGAAVLLFYTKFSEACKESWIPWDRECLKHWGSYLKKTLLLGANLYVEWISFEISVFIIGALNVASVIGAHGLAVNLTIAIFTIPLGNSTTMQTYMGNAVGQGSKYKAQKFMAAGLALNLVLTLLNILVLIFFNKSISQFFTNDEETMNILQTMLIIYSLTHLTDTFANHLGGILRVMGKEREVFNCYIFSYMVIAFNFQWFFGVAKGYGYVAVWIGTALGMYLMFGLMVNKIRKLDWDEAIAKLKADILETSQEDSSIYIEMKEV